jgi:hypothetical protein
MRTCENDDESKISQIYENGQLPMFMQSNKQSLSGKSAFDQTKAQSDPKYCLKVYERNHKWLQEKETKNQEQRRQVNMQRREQEKQECKF